MSLPRNPDPRSFDALHDEPSQWREEMSALLRSQGWGGEWQVAGEGTALVALLGHEAVLKLYPPFLADHWAFERGMLPRLHRRLSVPTPALLDSGTWGEAGERGPWVWTRLSMLPGRLLQDMWPGLHEAQRIALLRQIGTLMREVHALPVGEQAALAPPWSQFLAGQRAQVLHRHQRFGLPPHLLAELPAYTEGPVPGGRARLLTGEYTPMNLLVNAAGELSGMFDFGDGLVGPEAYDWLGPLTFLAAGQRPRMRAFVDGLGQPLAPPDELMRLFLLHRYSALPMQLRDVPGWQASADLRTLARRLFD
jgi:hygromycin-B 7''-O-kinase